MQDCPELIRRPVEQAAAAASRSASSRMIEGSDPPNSSTAFLRFSPAFEATARPAASEPVTVTAATFGFSITSATLEPGITRVEKQPSGSPAASKTSSMARAQPVTFEACLSTQVFPAISAGAAKRKTCQRGKFQGMMARITPSGS